MENYKTVLFMFKSSRNLYGSYEFSLIRGQCVVVSPVVIAIALKVEQTTSHTKAIGFDQTHRLKIDWTREWVGVIKKDFATHFIGNTWKLAFD